MAISKTTMPIAAKWLVVGKHNNIPSKTSDTPDKMLINFGFAKNGGMMRTYIFGFLKWFKPAKIYIVAIK